MRVSFQIATGSTEGVYFPVGQTMAGLISHPLGVGRCDTATVCGPAGVILSARTSEGSTDNLDSCEIGRVVHDIWTAKIENASAKPPGVGGVCASLTRIDAVVAWAKALARSI